VQECFVRGGCASAESCVWEVPVVLNLAVASARPLSPSINARPRERVSISDRPSEWTSGSLIRFSDLQLGHCMAAFPPLPKKWKEPVTNPAHVVRVAAHLVPEEVVFLRGALKNHGGVK